MLELLLAQYEDIFGEPFPLADLEGETEITVINIVYDCVSNNHKYEKGFRPEENHFPDAPGMEK